MRRSCLYPHRGPRFSAYWRLPFGLLLGLVLVSLPTSAWTPASQITLALEASKLAPPDLRRQIEKYPKRLQQGTNWPFKNAVQEAHYWHEDGEGQLDDVVFSEIDATIQAIKDHEPFPQIVERLGRVAHYVADANNPLNADDADSEESRYFVDFLRYAQSAQPRFSLVYYADEPMVDTDREMRLMIYRALHRGRELYPFVGAEYRRIGFESGRKLFDDRSTAFGIAAVTYSHALSDVARTFRYIWLQAGGTDLGSPLKAEISGLYLLPSRQQKSP